MCSEILLERHFYQALVVCIREVFQDQDDEETDIRELNANPGREGPPKKKRRLSPPPSPPGDAHASRATLLWTALQAACRCVGLISVSSSPTTRKSHGSLSIRAVRLPAQATLFGVLLEAVASIFKRSADIRNAELICGLLDTLIYFWNGEASTGGSQDDERHHAFATSCFQPSLSLLDLLSGFHSGDKSFVHPRNALERLIALHVIFPLRSLFNEQFTKKWRATADVLLYEHMETLLKAYSNHILSVQESAPPEMVTPSVLQQLPWIVLDVAAHSIPFSDLRRRDVEQQYVDSLFIWLVHVVWPHIPRIHSTGVLRQQFAVSRNEWVSPLERLLDTAHSAKLRISLPIVNYVLQGALAVDAKTIGWTVIVKIIRLDLNIIVSTSSLSSSKDFLEQVIARLESTTVTRDVYDLVRDQLILPLLRSYARSRALEEFASAWQGCLAEAMRIRYRSGHDQRGIPAVLVWEDDDVFEEFKTVTKLNAPPSMAERMLKDLIGPLKQCAETVGSTADVFAKMAIFCTILEITSAEGSASSFSQNHLEDLFSAAMEALRRKSDYQGQRWRLRKLIRLLAQLMAVKALPAGVDRLLEPDYHFVSLKNVYDSEESPNSMFPPQLLECLECFSLLLELAAKSELYEARLAHEVRQLGFPITDRGIYDYPLWDGRNSSCDEIDKLVAACVGRLLQKPQLFSLYPAAFKSFIDICLRDLTLENTTTLQVGASPNVLDLWLAVLQLENIAMSHNLRKVIFDHIANSGWTAGRQRQVSRDLLQNFPLKTLSKNRVREFADSVLEHLLEDYNPAGVETIAGDLSYLVYLDSIFPGSFIKLEQADKWIQFSETFLEWESGYFPQLKLMDSPDFMSFYRTAVQMMDRIIESVCIRFPTGTEYDHSLLNTIEYASNRLMSNFEAPSEDFLPFSGLQVMLRGANRRDYQHATSEAGRRLKKARDVFLQCLKWHLEKVVRTEWKSSTLHQLNLIAEAALCIDEGCFAKEVQEIILSVQKKLEEYKGAIDQSDPVKNALRIKASLQRQCLLSTSGPEQNAGENGFASEMSLASLVPSGDKLTNEDMAVLATEADTFVRRMGPAGWSCALQYLNVGSTQLENSPRRAVIVASILAHIEKPHLLQHPDLMQEVAKISRLDGRSKQGTVDSLFFALENCKTALELHSEIVNQSVLDHLLASLQAVASAADEHLRSSDMAGMSSGPKPFDIHERLCAVIGAILGRHRRRLNDRYHLLLPILQSILRCLFWPGQKAIEAQRGAATIAVTTFGKTLPTWLRDSTDPLPLSSAEQVSRLLSSLCNPTVSAARSSSKRHNELNDEVKKARRLAAQHVQYLVTEYCRCILDGQISPTMKDQLMPGMYSALDAIDRDLMRAMNAGMDPSSRAIFKNLYDDWTRFGKWDKS